MKIERNLATHDYQKEAEACRASGRIAINPYACPDGEGISTATGLRDLLDCNLDAGASGGPLFLILDRSTPIEDIISTLKLRDETYQRYRDQKAS